MAGTKTVAAVGLRDVQVATRLTTAGSPTWLDIPGVNDASYKQAVSEIDQWGDDTLLNTFYHSQKGTISVKTNYLAMAVLEKLSGSTVTSSAGIESIPIGALGELNPPHVSVKATIQNAVTDTGASATIRAFFYNCTVKTVFESIPEAAHGKLMEVTLNFNVYSSATSETGATLSEPAFGRLELQ